MGKGTGQIVVGGALAAVGVLAGPGGAWLVQAGASMVLSGVARSLTKTVRPLERQDLGRQVAEPMGGLPVVYGEARLGAQRVFMATTENEANNPTARSGQFLWLVCAISHGPLASIGRIYFDDRLGIKADGLPELGTGKGPSEQFLGYAHAWKAYGTPLQCGVDPRARVGGPAAVTGSLRVGSRRRVVEVGVGHGFVQGDCVMGTGVVGLLAGVGYTVMSVTATNITLSMSKTQLSSTGGGGTIDYYTPDLTAMFGAGWQADARGRDVAYLVLRLQHSGDRWPNGIPRVTVETTGAACLDTRTAVAVAITGTVTGTALAAGAWPSRYTVPATAHGLVVGDIVRIAGSSEEAVNGVHRVFTVPDANSFVVLTDETMVASATGGTVTKLEATINPVVALRDYLTNGTYGAGVPESFIDDTAFEDEADYCDGIVYVPDETTETFEATRTIASSTAAAPSVVTTTGPHGYPEFDLVGRAVTISGHSSAALNARWGLTYVSPDSFSLVFSNNPVAGTGGTAQLEVLQTRFALGGVLDTNEALKSNIEKVLGACRGQLVYQGGVYRPTIRKPLAASMAFTEDDIVGDWNYAGASQSELPNVLQATWLNPKRDWQYDQVSFPEPEQANLFREADGYLSMMDVDLPLTNNRGRALQILQVLRREARAAVRVSVTMKERAMAATVGDVVTISAASPGWVAKPFWVTAIEIAEDATVRLGLHEYQESAYDLDAIGDEPFERTTILPNQTTQFSLAVATTILTTEDRRLVVRVLVADAFPNGPASATISYESAGIPTTETLPLPVPNPPDPWPVTPASGQVVDPSDELVVSEGNYVDFSIHRPGVGEGMGRVTFTVTAEGRTPAVDAVDVPPVEVIPWYFPVEITRMRFNTTDGRYEIWYRAYSENPHTGVVTEDPGGFTAGPYGSLQVVVAREGTVIAPGSITYHTPKETDGWRISWPALSREAFVIRLRSVPTREGVDEYLGEFIGDSWVPVYTETVAPPAGGLSIAPVGTDLWAPS